MLIAVLRVLDAEVMPARPHLLDRVEREVVVGGGKGRFLEIALDHLQDLAVHDEFLGARDQPALQPACGVVDHVGARLHR